MYREFDGDSGQNVPFWASLKAFEHYEKADFLRKRQNLSNRDIIARKKGNVNGQREPALWQQKQPVPNGGQAVRCFIAFPYFKAIFTFFSFLSLKGGCTKLKWNFVLFFRMLRWCEKVSKLYTP